MAASTSSAGSAPQLPPLTDYWDSLKRTEDEETSTSESLSSSLTSISTSSSRAINWMIENRGGMAMIAGLLIVPSQFIGSDRESSLSTLSSFPVSENVKMYHCHNHTTNLDYIIYYPPGVDQTKRTKCVLYHNPNGITTAGYFFEGRFDHTPSRIAEIERCPLIMYDYRGTGLNKDTEPNSSLSSFRPTYQTVVDDGLLMTQEALRLFDTVSVWGSSLGGGVATVSLDRYLVWNPEDEGRVTLTNHDSFTTTPEVVLPGWRRTARVLGGILGATIDAETAMRSLIVKNIGIKVLCHLIDPVIPAGSRMAEFVQTMDLSGRKVTIITSPEYGHANLSDDLRRELIFLRS